MVVCRTNPSIYPLASKKCLATPYDENAANKVLIFFFLERRREKNYYLWCSEQTVKVGNLLIFLLRKISPKKLSR